MNAKQYLQRIQRLEMQIEMKKEEVERLREIASGIGGISNGERVQTSKRYDKMGDTISNMVDIEREAQELINQYWKERAEIIEKINAIPNTNQYIVLYSIFVLGKTMKETALTMKMSMRNVNYIHKNALESFEKMFLS